MEKYKGQTRAARRENERERYRKREREKNVCECVHNIDMPEVENRIILLSSDRAGVCCAPILYYWYYIIPTAAPDSCPFPIASFIHVLISSSPCITVSD